MKCCIIVLILTIISYLWVYSEQPHGHNAQDIKYLLEVSLRRPRSMLSNFPHVSGKLIAIYSTYVQAAILRPTQIGRAAVKLTKSQGGYNPVTQWPQQANSSDKRHNSRTHIGKYNGALVWAISTRNGGREAIKHQEFYLARLIFLELRRYVHVHARPLAGVIAKALSKEEGIIHKGSEKADNLGTHNPTQRRQGTKRHSVGTRFLNQSETQWSVIHGAKAT